MEYQQVVNFWFHEIDSKLWFEKNEEFDQLMTKKYSTTFNEALAGKFSSWRQTPEGRLAEVLVLDQFSRNIFRGSAKAFSGDALALQLAQEAVALGEDKKLNLQQRAFLYMPYMHSEDRQVHEEAVKLFSEKGLENNLHFEILHKNIIDRFGRYPHRNEILGRPSTVEEIEFLKQPNSSF
ncbi:hypothetical protein A11Q_278 [Pseudobdellovibrio exovorus JSS]|uniref:Transmembrane protein n=2 Tax=Pseudobdellovibrio exovorus TaxID=453816 RepID=M4V5Q8_9BACT|nr:DUF924 family protein [Pseudobdellovibrio exovorus]AGH94498.1 hypothetical protein A11Q_278 [Pseudobdellovibrio exovorus JSS]